MSKSVYNDTIKCRCCNKEMDTFKNIYGSCDHEQDDFTMLDWFYCKKCSSFFATIENKHAISISYNEASVDFFKAKKNEKLKTLKKKLLISILFDIESEIDSTELERYDSGENMFNEDEWHIEEYIGRYKCVYNVKFNKYDDATVEILKIV